MSTLLAFAILILLLGAVVALVERNHRRTAGLPGAPLGTDVSCDVDLARVLHDLHAR
jgi:hypothetical protein